MTQHQIPAMFEQAVNAPLQELPPLVHLLTYLPREYPLLPLDALQPQNPRTPNVDHAFYRNQRTYTPSSSSRFGGYSNSRQKPPQNQPIPELEPLLAFHSHMRSSTASSVNKLDETVLFDRIASHCNTNTVAALIHAWTTYFHHHHAKLPGYAHDLLPCTLLFLLKLRYAKTTSLAEFQAHYAQYLCSTFQSLGAIKCDLTWDSSSEIRQWTVLFSNQRPLIITPHPRIPDTIHITAPRAFERPHHDLLEVLLNPQKQDPFLEQCIAVAHTNGFSTY